MTTQDQKLMELLSNNDMTFFIPPYQRNYEWTVDQCEVFLNDIVRTYEVNRTRKQYTEHFLGSVTYFQTETPFGQPRRLVLIDGQQRVTTTMLFLIAVRDTIDDPSMAEYIEDKFLRNGKAADDSLYKIKLKQVEADWDVYRRIIMREAPEGNEKNSCIYRNYRYFCNRLQALKGTGADMKGLVEDGLCRFSVITIELNPTRNTWENPQEIFESMNSLGKPLSLADLVRNYLLLGMTADEQDSNYKKYWLHIEKTLPGMVSNFIRDYMQMRDMKPYKKSKEQNWKDLYSGFKTLFADESSTDLLKDLSRYADLYAMIVPGLKKTGNAGIDALLHDIQALGVTTAYAFLMSLFNEWTKGELSDRDMTDILEAFFIYTARRRFVGVSLSENKNYPALARRIPELVAEQHDRKTKMFEILSGQDNHGRLPNDTEVRQKLLEMNFYSFGYSKLILALVEESLTKNRPVDDKIQIEHIMPQTLNAEWRKTLGKECDELHQKWVHNIGNLTLIRHNSELGQKPFAEKLVVYENNSGLQIAKSMITNRTKWTPDEMKARAEWLCDRILNDVLPIPDKMRKANNFVSKQQRSLSFKKLGLVGKTISFRPNPQISAKVVDNKKVEFEGKVWKLSPLTRELQERRAMLNKSGCYSGPEWWEFNGRKLSDLIVEANHSDSSPDEDLATDSTLLDGLDGNLFC